MKQAKELHDTLKQMFNSGDSIVPAIVKSVDKASNTCEVAFDELELGGVRLQATVNENQKGAKLYPLVDSVVLVQKLSDKGEYFVVMVSEVEEVLFEIGTASFKMKEDGFVLMKGTDNLRNVLDDLMGQVKALNSKVQAIVVSPGYGTTPDVAGLAAINTQIEATRTKAKNILQ